MRTVRFRPAPGEGVLIGLVVAAGATFAVGVVGAADAAAESTDGTSVSRGADSVGPECAPLPADSFGAAERIAEGWRGDPSDGVEALYPPGCLTLP